MAMDKEAFLRNIEEERRLPRALDAMSSFMDIALAIVDDPDSTPGERVRALQIQASFSNIGERIESAVMRLMALLGDTVVF